MFSAVKVTSQSLLLFSRYIVPSKRQENLALTKFLFAPHDGPVSSVNAFPMATAVVGQLEKSESVTGM